MVSFPTVDPPPLRCPVASETISSRVLRINLRPRPRASSCPSSDGNAPIGLRRQNSQEGTLVEGDGICEGEGLTSRPEHG